MQPFRSVGLAHLGVFLPLGTRTACLSVDVLHSSKDGLLLGVVELACWAKPGSERRKTVQRRLTERRGVEAGHRAGHQGVGDLSEGQQARWVVPFPLLLLDQTLQLLLEGLEDGRRERMTETEHEEGVRVSSTIHQLIQSVSIKLRTFEDCYGRQKVCSL